MPAGSDTRIDPFTVAEPPGQAAAFPVEARAPAPPPSPPAFAAPAAAPPAAPPATPSEPAFDPYAGTDAPPPPPRPARAASTRVVFKARADRERRVPVPGDVEVDGKPVPYVVVRRITTGELIDYLDALRALPDGEVIRFPIYFLPWGEAIDDDVWNGLDPDLTDELTALSRDFLPSRFLPARSDSTTQKDPGPAQSGTPDTTGSSSG